MQSTSRCNQIMNRLLLLVSRTRRWERRIKLHCSTRQKVWYLCCLLFGNQLPQFQRLLATLHQKGPLALQAVQQQALMQYTILHTNPSRNPPLALTTSSLTVASARQLHQQHNPQLSQHTAMHSGQQLHQTGLGHRRSDKRTHSSIVCYRRSDKPTHSSIVDKIEKIVILATKVTTIRTCQIANGLKARAQAWIVNSLRTG